MVRSYKETHTNLMLLWENECRKWIQDISAEPVRATFFRDGVIDPETWFSNDFRPLFILKEVHDTSVDDRCVNFVAMEDGSDYDIWNRRGMWRALGTLANGILRRENGELDFSYEDLYSEDLISYHETLKHIAIVNVKKVSGGGNVNSDTSIQTKHFTDHAHKFKELLQKQILLIRPSVIVFCGKEIENCFDLQHNTLYGIPTITGLHPATNPNCRRNAFFYETIEKVHAATSGSCGTKIT